MFKNVKVRKSLLILLKVLVILLVLFFFWKKIREIEWIDFSELSVAHPIFLLLAAALVFANWFFEWIKWMVIVHQVAPKVPRKEITFSLLSGIATGVVTPNRIGNFIGRVIYFNRRNRVYLIAGTLYGNLAQFVVTIVFGCIGFYFYPQVTADSFYTNGLINVSGAFALMSIFIYLLAPFYMKGFTNLVFRGKNIINFTLHFQRVIKKLFIQLLVLSTFRYAIFIVQYVFILFAFGIDFQIGLIYSLFFLFLITTLTPSFILGKLMIRETVALYVLGILISNPVVIIASSLSLWLMNLGIPSLLGLFFFIRSKKVAKI